MKPDEIDISLLQNLFAGFIPAYKTLHPFGQGIMGVYYNVSNTSSDLVHYIRKIDAAQAKGLGLALHDLDHEKDWQTHLTFVFKSYLIHFESKEQVYDLLQQIRDTNDKGIEDWLSYY
ncbi:hypothetical protein RhiirB3_394439 [Rhizophagus irregularis]|nr:hypothetical protein RhiirB3_394439 [Rhizophagus irregularis]